MICSQCGSENREGAKFCDECGRPLLPEIVPESDAADLSSSTADVDRTQELEAVDADGDAKPSDSLESLDAAPFHSGPHAGVHRDDESDDEEDLPQSEFTLDLRGFDECLVEPGYVPPRVSWNSGDTMELPRIDDAPSVPRRDFRAPDQNEKKGLFRKGDAAKKLKQAEQTQEQARRQAQQEQKQDQKQKTPKRSGKLKAGLLVAVCLIAIGVAALGLTYQFEMWGGKTIPNVVGLTQADATFMLESKGFSVRETKVKSDETEGLVLMVDPGVDSRVSAGSEVVIHVSQSRSIPNVVGMQRDEALALLEQEGFEQVKVETQKSDEQEGLVVGVTPAAGEKAKAVTSITVTVTAPYCVPDVMGLTWDEMIAAIEGEGYVYDVAYVYDDSVAEGTVLGTEPAAGEKLPSGSVVVIQLAKSRGAELEAAAMNYLQGAGSITLGGVSYAIMSVDSVAYEGNDTTSFTVTCAAVTVLDGETVYGSNKQKSGVIVWDANNNIVSVS
ncbi:PASTA domain-containing protein [Adlercreutzia sp. ZJ141]|uniref:PASTA domain-containing protein n=1 Tax=Adlercreutzia sp. ZJ141 TaxID=2709406 RepID=UPI0013E9DA1B|nr:PASTA domain-containing protein [Adlercreutzia sp. ZJ141]